MNMSIATYDTNFRHHPVHRNIPFIPGDSVLHLARKGQPNPLGVGASGRQKPVVIPLAESQPDPLAVESQARNDEEVNVLGFYRAGMTRLQDPESRSDPTRTRIPPSGQVFDLREEQFRAPLRRDQGDRHSISTRQGLAQQGARPDLQTEIHITGQPHGIPAPKTLLQIPDRLEAPEPLHDGFAMGLGGLRTERLPPVQELPAQPGLIRNNTGLGKVMKGTALKVNRHANAPIARRSEDLRGPVSVGSEQADEPRGFFSCFQRRRGELHRFRLWKGGGQIDSRGVRAARFLPTLPGLFSNHDEFDQPITDVISAWRILPLLVG